jgi:diaminopimelate epimerase
MNFTKMHGLGNDYVYINCFEQSVENPSELALTLSDRHMAIGSDGLILICPSDQADARMEMYNSDGSRAEMCGNGIRCVAKYVYDHNISKGGEEYSVPGWGTFSHSLQIETDIGVLRLGLDVNENDLVENICVNMGQPILKASEIPVALDVDQVIDVEVEFLGDTLAMTCVSMGNPHAVFFCEHVWDVKLEKIGSIIEHHEMFPERVNVHFVSVNSPSELVMRTWERGSGITMACGTGACAVLAAGVLTGRCQRNVNAHLPGGDLQLYWSLQDNCIYMTGPAVEVFSGTWNHNQ